MKNKEQMIIEAKTMDELGLAGEIVYKITKINGKKPDHTKKITKLYERDKPVFYTFYGEPECPVKYNTKIIIDGGKEEYIQPSDVL